MFYEKALFILDKVFDKNADLSRNNFFVSLFLSKTHTHTLSLSLSFSLCICLSLSTCFFSSHFFYVCLSVSLLISLSLLCSFSSIIIHLFLCLYVCRFISFFPSLCFNLSHSLSLCFLQLLSCWQTKDKIVSIIRFSKRRNYISPFL